PRALYISSSPAAALPLLHSFPTRRSSDLVDTTSVRRMLSVRPGDWFRQDQLYVTQRDLYGLGMFRSVNVVLADTAPRPGGDSTVDRKSTRLNSSHVAISYAVFCLKKKNKG